MANIDSLDHELGEIVSLEPELWAAEIDAGFLSPVDADGNRIIQLETDFTESADG